MREDWNGMAQLGAVDTEWVGCYCTARLPSAWTDMVVYVCELHALKQDSEVIGSFQPWGGKSENVWKGGGERREESRVEQKACLVSAGENGVHEGGWRETEEQKKKRHLQSHYRFVLQLATLFIADICVQ